MSYIPEDARWFLAELVEEIRVEDDPRNVVHINMVLIEANTPELAYERALELGDELNSTYHNPDGKLVTVTFRGLHKLNVVYDELEHGAELFYHEHIDLPETKIAALITDKQHLSVFKPRIPPDLSAKPNYFDKVTFETQDVF